MQPSASDQRSIEERVARISKLIALQPREDPTGPSFYDICNDIQIKIRPLLPTGA